MLRPGWPSGPWVPDLYDRQNFFVPRGGRSIVLEIIPMIDSSIIKKTLIDAMGMMIMMFLDVSESVTCSSCSYNFSIISISRKKFRLEKFSNNLITSRLMLAQNFDQKFLNFWKNWLMFFEILGNFLINQRKFHRISGSISNIFALLNVFRTSSRTSISKSLFKRRRFALWYKILWYKL